MKSTRTTKPIMVKEEEIKRLKDYQLEGEAMWATVKRLLNDANKYKEVKT